jgi:hypothetical protein
VFFQFGAAVFHVLPAGRRRQHRLLVLGRRPLRRWLPCQLLEYLSLGDYLTIQLNHPLHRPIHQQRKVLRAHVFELVLRPLRLLKQLNLPPHPPLKLTRPATPCLILTTGIYTTG